MIIPIAAGKIINLRFLNME